MVHFVGAGSGAPDLITVRGARLLSEADVIIWAGSLVNPKLLNYAKADCEIHDSAKLTLEQVIDIIKAAEAAGKTTVRLHTGDSSIYGAVREQFDELEKLGIEYDVCPGVSAFCGAAAALKAEYTLPEVSQSVIITRAAGRTPVPERESIRAFAAHRATMVLFLSTSLAGDAQRELIEGGVMGSFDRMKQQTETLREKPIVVWGTGLMYRYEDNAHPPVRPLEIRALRGELTRQQMSAFMGGAKISCLLADPGLLAPYLVPAQEKVWDVGIVPHFRDADSAVFAEMRDFYGNAKLIDVKEMDIINDKRAKEKDKK